MRRRFCQPFSTRSIALALGVLAAAAACTSSSSSSSGTAAKVTLVAGDGSQGFGGDGGPAVRAQLGTPGGIAADHDGNLYISDSTNNRVRKVDSSGRIATVAGDGEARFAGDGGKAVAASLNRPTGLAVDESGNLYVADSGNRRVRKVDSHGRITTVAGNGERPVPGAPAGTATTALDRPIAVAALSDGRLAVVDSARVRLVDAKGTITTIAGGGRTPVTPEAAPATAVALSSPTAVVAGSGGELFVALPGTGQIVRLDKKGTAAALAGDPVSGLSGITLDGAGNLFVANGSDNQVTRIGPKGQRADLVVWPQTPPTTADSSTDPALLGPLHRAAALATDGDGNVFVVHTDTNQVSRISNADSGVLTMKAAEVSGGPTIDVMKPTAGGAAGGTTVVIQGRNLSSATTVLFGDKPATLIHVDAGVILVLSPPGTAGKPVGVTVANPGSKPSAPTKFDYADGWQPAAPMVFSRLWHTATVLGDGQVLVTGGHQRFCIGCIPLNSTELYDAARNVWTLSGFMHTARMEHTATLLDDGKVLVAGGKGWNKEEGGDREPKPQALASSEVYDPASGSWSDVGNMVEPRFSHTATLLGGRPCDAQPRPAWCGQVLVVGGNLREEPRDPIASAELFDPAKGTWSSAGALPEARANHSATLLPDGRVMIAGGLGPGDKNAYTSLASVQLYDPATNSWSVGPPMGVSRVGHTATTLGDGRVLVVGGFNKGEKDTLKSAELFDPVSMTWTIAGIPSTARTGHTATLLPSGMVLVAGGGPLFEDPTVRPETTSSAEVYDPASNHWNDVRPLNTARGVHAAVALDSPACRTPTPPPYCGAVLVMGGEGTNTSENPKFTDFPLFTSELYR